MVLENVREMWTEVGFYFLGLTSFVYYAMQSLVIIHLNYVWLQVPKTGKGKKKALPVNKDRFISKMFLRGDSVIIVLRNPKWEILSYCSSGSAQSVSVYWLLISYPSIHSWNVLWNCTCEVISVMKCAYLDYLVFLNLVVYGLRVYKITIGCIFATCFHLICDLLI